MALAIVASPRFADHLTPPGHPERVERHAVMQVVAAEFRERGGTILDPRSATDQELARIHDGDYITRVRETAGRATALDPDTFTSPDTCEVALLAAGAVLTGVDHVLGPWSRARRDRRLRRASRQWHAVELLWRSVGAVRVVASVSLLSGHRRAR